MKQDTELTAMPRAPLEGSIVKCYRYLSGWWEKSLRESRLKLSAATEFNDAFDCSGTCIGEFSEEVIARHLKRPSSVIPLELVNVLCDKSILPTMRHEYSSKIARCLMERTLFSSQTILCFSNPKTIGADSLMWSHYGNKWRGVRLGFELLYENHYNVMHITTSPYALSPIKYSSRRPILNLSKIEEVESDPLYSRYFYDTLYTKAEPWSYENEWRLFCDEKFSSEDKGMRFWDFNKVLLRTIDIGPGITVDQQDRILCISKAFYPHVKVRSVVMSDSDYNFTYQTILSPSINLPVESAYQCNNCLI